MDKPLLTQGRLFVIVTSVLCAVLIVMVVYFFHSMKAFQRIPPQPYVTIVNNNISTKGKLLMLKLEIIEFSRDRSEQSLAKMKMKARVYRASILQDLHAERTVKIHQQFGDVKKLASIRARLDALGNNLDQMTLDESELKMKTALTQLDSLYSQLNVYMSSFVSEVQKNQMMSVQQKQQFYSQQYTYLAVISACLAMMVGVISWMYLNQIKLSRDLKERTDKMEEAKKLAEQSATAKARFLANMSHEMRTPLNAVIGLSHKEYYLNTDEQTRSFVAMINDSGKHLLKLINSVLDLSKIEQGKMKLDRDVFYCSELIKLSKTIFVETNKPDVEIIFCSPMEKDYKIVGDKTKLLQIINNLSYNALKFTDSGYVDVSLSVETLDQQSYLKLSVIDTGIGMSQQQLNKVFEEFVQADDSITRKYGGTGLGLSICQSLINMMKGTLEVQSELGQGTQFNVSIPVVVEGEKTILCPQIHNQRIRVVAQDIRVQRLISSELNQLGLFDDNGELTVHYLSGAQGFSDNDAIVEGKPCIVIGDLHAAVPDSEWVTKLTKPYDIFSLINAVCSRNTGQEKSANIDVAPNSTGLSALIVEDMRVNQIVAQKMLNTLQVETTTAGNGQECLDILKQHHFDIVFMDIQMPVMDGIEALKTIRRENLAPGTAIVALTANNSDRDALHYIEQGFNDVVPKPVRMDLMQRVLNKYITAKPAQ